MKITLKQLTPLLIVFTILVASDFINAAPWDAPTSNPPSASNNAPEPINVSIDAQTKGGQLTVLRSEALSRMISPLYCDALGNCVDGTTLVTNSGGSIDTSNFLTTGDTDQTKEGSLTVNGGIYAPFFCDESGGNCSSASSIFTMVNGGGGGDYLDTSNTSQSKSGDLSVGGLVVTDRELHFDNAGTGGDYIRWVSGEGLYGYENGSFAWKLGRDGSIDAARYCDANGNNCTDASDLGGTSIDTSNFLDTSNSNQIKSGDLTLGGLRVNGDPEIVNSRPAILFNDNDSGERQWLQVVGSNDMSIRQDRNGSKVFNDDGAYSFILDGGSNISSDSDDYARFANQVQANEYCNRSGGDCTTPGDIRDAVEAVLNNGLAIECVSGVHRESGSTNIQTSSAGNNYSFSDVFVASFRNSGTQPELRCKGGWTMTGCSAGTNANGAGDNDEYMDGRNMCVGDQVGDNVIHARCCQVILK